jgi:hypothetical protein
MEQQEPLATMAPGPTPETLTPISPDAKPYPEGLEPIAEEKKPKFQEGQVLSVNYTVRGPVRVVWREGKQVVEEQKPNLAFALPQSLSTKDTILFIRFCLMVDQIAQQEKRNVPMLVNEAELAVPKAAIKKFRNMGLVEIETLRMHKDLENNHVDIKSHAFCWLTPNGMGLRDILHAAARQADQQAKEHAERAAQLKQDPEH